MAAELVGSALVTSFIEAVFDKLASPATLEYFRKKNLDGNVLNKLRITLLSINAVVEDAEQQQLKSSNAKKWLYSVRDHTLDAEDILEQFDFQVSQLKAESDVSTTNTSKVSTLIKASLNSFHKNLESRIQEIAETLEQLLHHKDVYFEKGTADCSDGYRQNSATYFPVKYFICGREDDLLIINGWLISDSNMLSIISLVGMGGIGKSTLAIHLFNDMREKELFDITAWVYVSQEFNIVKVTHDILVALKCSTNDTQLNSLQEQLNEKLTGKRFLLVLDNVWNDNIPQWVSFIAPFRDCASGSKLLVTTRSEKVARVIESNQVHRLQQLDDQHSWQLFSKHAFQVTNDSSHEISHDFELVGRKIVNKCQGLPLALEHIGRLLHINSSSHDWDRILASNIWDLKEKEVSVIPALMLSFQNLPSHLKKCFVYCALFPKGFLFEKEDLILLWISQNFLQRPPHKGGSMIEAGEHCFNQLVQSSFFQPSTKYECHYVMHDLLHDLAKYIAGKLCFTFKTEPSQTIEEMTRHFSFVCDALGSSKELETLDHATRLRTFLPLSSTSHQHMWFLRSNPLVLTELFSKLKLLRVLSLHGYYNMDELPETIGSLIHLRQLDVCRTRLRKLPDSVCSLLNLQILKLKDCPLFEELPINLHKLVNLCYLDFRGTRVKEMPVGIGNLKNLEVLTSFYVGKNTKSSIQQLGQLNLHGKLSLFELQNIVSPSDALSADLISKKHLVKLGLNWSENSNDSKKEREVFHMLQPSKYLKKLSIKGYGSTEFPNWFGDCSLSNVVSLKLSKCENCILLPSLGSLPLLKHLRITGLSGITMIGKEFYRNARSSTQSIPFPSLETLSFKDMAGWEEWESDDFPRLKKLSIGKCPNLEGRLPEKLPCLVNLKIFECKKLVTSVPLSEAILELHLSDCKAIRLGYCSSKVKYLEIRRCFMDDSSMRVIESTLSHCDTSIKSLKMEDCPMMDVPLGKDYKFLVKLDINGSCDSLKFFPLDQFPNLESVDIYKCRNLEVILHDREHLRLTSISIGECPKFVSFSKGKLDAPRLLHFDISQLESFKSLPECMDTLLPSLYKLSVKDCPQLKSCSVGGLPSSLRYLFLIKCTKLLIDSLEWALPINSSLCDMHIEEIDMESFPNQMLLPLTLTSLTITGCRNLKKLDYKGLDRHPALTTLVLSNCPSIPCLPEEGLPNSISTLHIWGGCPLLQQRCKKPTGQDYEKISHIRGLRIEPSSSSTS